MKKSIGIILMVLLFLSMATGLGIAIGALVASSEIEENNPYIKDGNWWIGEVDTGIPATGEAPVIEINSDGYWVIDGVVTEVKALGQDGGNLDFKIDGDWLYIKNNDGNYEPIWNFAYNVDNVEDCAKEVLDSKVAELKELFSEENSAEVNELINNLINEMQNTDLTNVDSVEKIEALESQLDQAIEKLEADLAEQLSKEVKVTIILNSKVIDEYIAEKGDVITKPTCSEKAGYTLIWYSDEEVYDFEAALTKDTVLEGVYEANTYNIKYVVDGNELTEMSTYKFGEDAVANIKEPEKEGYKFNGWVDANGVAYETKPMPIDGFVLYASWVANKYVVIYDLNYDGSNREYQDVVYNEAYELTQPERKGYKFIGWYLNGEQVQNQGEAWLVADDVTLVAEWEGFKLNASVEGSVVTLNVTAIDELQIDNMNTIEIYIKVKTSDVNSLNAKTLIEDKEIDVKSSVDGEHTIYLVTFKAETDLTVDNNVFAELTVDLSIGVQKTTLEVLNVSVKGVNEYLGEYDVEYNNSIEIQGNL